MRAWVNDFGATTAWIDHEGLNIKQKDHDETDTVIINIDDVPDFVQYLQRIYDEDTEANA